MMKHEKTIGSVMPEQRDKQIVRTSVLGIGANVLLSAFKAAVGLLSNSIAVVLDAVNNLSDALSSVITIIGTKLSGKAPDKKHPMGHGRVEYIASTIVSAIVLYAGITSLVESVKKIIKPETPSYNTIALVILGVAVAVKLFLGVYVKRKGVSLNSGALTASGTDALMDAVISTSVLASAVIYLIWGVSLEAYVGVVISGFIIKAGIELLMESLNDILGRRPDRELSLQVKALISEENEVRGAYDLILYNYGPDKNYASVHLELPDTMTVEEVDRLTRRLETKVYTQTGVILTGVGVYSYNTKDDDISTIRNQIQEVVMAHDFALQMHGFYVDIQKHLIRFDVVISFEADRKEAVRVLQEEVRHLYPEYSIMIAPDVDITD